MKEVEPHGHRHVDALTWSLSLTSARLFVDEATCGRRQARLEDNRWLAISWLTLPGAARPDTESDESVLDSFAKSGPPRWNRAITDGTTARAGALITPTTTIRTKARGVLRPSSESLSPSAKCRA